jgi:foldase protein PrsA
MKRRSFATIAGVLLIAGIASACSGTDSSSAAKINGTAIDDHDFAGELQAYADNKLYQAEQQAGNGVQSGAEGTVSNEFARQVLLNDIVYTLVAQENDRRGLDPSTQDPEKVKQFAVSRFSPSNSDAKVFEAFPESFQKKALAQGAEALTLQEALTVPASSDADLEAIYKANPENYKALCASHILVATEEEAKAVEDRLAKGEDFAAVAKEVSTDTGSGANGGSLQGQDGKCVPVSNYDKDFTKGALATPVGQVSPPVQSQFGWHVIKVEDIQQQSFDEAKPSLQQAAAQESQSATQDALSTWYTAALKSDIWVNPRYGTFDAAAGMINPPGLSTNTTTATPSTTATSSPSDTALTPSTTGG